MIVIKNDLTAMPTSTVSWWCSLELTKQKPGLFTNVGSIFSWLKTGRDSIPCLKALLASFIYAPNEGIPRSSDAGTDV